MIQILAVLIDLLPLVITVVGIVLMVGFLLGWYASKHIRQGQAE